MVNIVLFVISNFRGKNEIYAMLRHKCLEVSPDVSLYCTREVAEENIADL